MIELDQKSKQLNIVTRYRSTWTSEILCSSKVKRELLRKLRKKWRRQQWPNLPHPKYLIPREPGGGTAAAGLTAPLRTSPKLPHQVQVDDSADVMWWWSLKFWNWPWHGEVHVTRQMLLNKNISNTNIFEEFCLIQTNECSVTCVPFLFQSLRVRASRVGRRRRSVRAPRGSKKSDRNPESQEATSPSSGRKVTDDLSSHMTTLVWCNFFSSHTLT